MSSASKSDNSVLEPTCHKMIAENYRRLQKTEAFLQVYNYILSKKSVVKVITRYNVSPATVSALRESIILEYPYVEEEDFTLQKLLSRFSLSYASYDRHKKKVNDEIAKLIKDNWTPPQINNIHWCLKVVAVLEYRYNKLEIKPVLISAESET